MPTGSQSGRVLFLQRGDAEEDGRAAGLPYERAEDVAEHISVQKALHSEGIFSYSFFFFLCISLCCAGSRVYIPLSSKTHLVCIILIFICLHNRHHFLRQGSSVVPVLFDRYPQPSTGSQPRERMLPKRSGEAFPRMSAVSRERAEEFIKQVPYFALSPLFILLKNGD
jgi:hypothetical protein